MLNTIFNGIFDSSTVSVITPAAFLVCVAVSLASGFILAFSYSFRTKCSGSFQLTLGILPMLVCVVIMMVNGNIGTGVAVAGAFSLVRFRSNPGKAKEIGAIFGAMAVGLIAGMGYLAYALLFALLISLVLFAWEKLNPLADGKGAKNRVLTVTIPESLNYTEVFDDLFGRYLDRYELVNVKTTNMGSLYKLTYDITEKDPAAEKEMIDAIRCRNGNLEISVSRQIMPEAEL